MSCCAFVSFRFSFRMHNEQFNLENADFIRFLLFIQEMSRSIAHAVPSHSSGTLRSLQLYTHLPKDNARRPAPTWCDWDQLMIVAMINRLKLSTPHPAESNMSWEGREHSTQFELCQHCLYNGLTEYGCITNTSLLPEGFG